MKNFLSLAICFFCLSSCSIEPEPGATKLAIQNDSGVRLLNIKWSGNEFGDMGSGDKQERNVSSEDYGRVSFKFEDGREYRTYDQITIRQHHANKFVFTDFILVIDNSSAQKTLINAYAAN